MQLLGNVIPKEEGEGGEGEESCSSHISYISVARDRKHTHAHTQRQVMTSATKMKQDDGHSEACRGRAGGAAVFPADSRRPPGRVRSTEA